MAGTATWLYHSNQHCLAMLIIIYLENTALPQCVSLQVSMAPLQISPEIKKSPKPEADRSKTGKGKNMKDVRLQGELQCNVQLLLW